MAKVERGLGRGLDALFGGPGEPAALKDGSDKHVLPVNRISPNPEQPRKAFDEAALNELAESIREAIRLCDHYTGRAERALESDA